MFRRDIKEGLMNEKTENFWAKCAGQWKKA